MGLDVDDQAFHGASWEAEAGESLEFRCRPTLKGLVGEFKKLQRRYRGFEIRACYEASYIGFTLQREISVGWAIVAK